MTITQVIERVDELAPNQYTGEQKKRWLKDFDGRVFREVFRTHEPGGSLLYAYNHDGDDGEELELLIPDPYADNVYSYYLLSRIAEANAEIQKYNLYATLFNQEYQGFVNWFNRNRMPKAEGGWRY